VREECADVLIYLVRLADVLGLDLLAAANEKIARNETRTHPRSPGATPSRRPEGAMALVIEQSADIEHFRTTIETPVALEHNRAVTSMKSVLRALGLILPLDGGQVVSR
jgi:hypothetical protein